MPSVAAPLFSIHGVPGDFFLRALDHIRPSGLQWIGNANELCAGYAADGYARAGHHIAARRAGRGPRVGALFTTYGVGELSAINAVAGSYAESIPVVHLVGTPSRRPWRSASADRPVHHTLGDGRMGIYGEMAKQIMCAQTRFHEFSDAVAAVHTYDAVLEKCVLASKPVYVSVPSGMVEAPVPAELLDMGLRITAPANDSELEDDLVEKLAAMVKSAQYPLLVVDGLSYPFDFLEEAHALARLLPTACFGSGMGAVDESIGKTWLGPLTGPTEYSSKTDLLFMLGPILADTNTAAWTAIPPARRTILFSNDSVDIRDESALEVKAPKYTVRGKPVLQKLVQRLADYATLPETLQKHSAPPTAHKGRSDGPIQQDSFWATMSSFLKPNDTVLLANGTPLIGGRDMSFPDQTQVVASSIWCSIGQMLPAAQGIALGKRDQDIPGRTILFEGDGSFQVTCQALSDIIRYELDVTIFIVNNAGYTYERWLNGMKADYNDVPDWRYTQIATTFGAKSKPQYPVFTRQVRTSTELDSLLAEQIIHDDKGLKIVEVVMAPEDVPEKAKAGLRGASQALRALH